jgi:hypothetical protein
MFTTYPWLRYGVGYAVACFVAHVIVAPAVNKLWALTEADFKRKDIPIPPVPVRVNKPVGFWHGVAERGVYATCVILGKPEGIAVWLAFKAVVRWKMSDKEDPRHIPGSPIYMIGTALNVGFGIVGGFIALGRWSF